MPAPERSDLNQVAVLWPYLGLIDGEPVLGNPTELKYPNGVRWNTARTDTKDAKGQKITLDATAIVNQEIAVDSLIWLGQLSDWYGSGSATRPDSEVHQIVTFKEVPDLKGRESTKTIGMMRWRGSSPP